MNYLSTGEIVMQVTARLSELEKDKTMYQRWYNEQTDQTNKYRKAYELLLDKIPAEKKAEIDEELNKLGL